MHVMSGTIYRYRSESIIELIFIINCTYNGIEGLSFSHLKWAIYIYLQAFLILIFPKLPGSKTVETSSQ